ncbi:MAG: RNase H family protein, partial [Candidatus Bipolaricaulaceae bacterium]
MSARRCDLHGWACLGNPGPGGWDIFIWGPHRKEVSGWELKTTNNRMELRAAIEALRALKEPAEVDLYTDSAYLKRGVTEWL